LDTALSTLLSAPVLFFGLGLIGALVSVEVRVSENFSKGIAIFLLTAIGLKGGIALADEGGNGIIAAALAGILLSAATPFLAYGMLKHMTRFNRREAAALAAHYGSISIVTFIAASTVLGEAGIAFGAGMVAVAALMEAPAIASGLALAGRTQEESVPMSKVLKTVIWNESIYLILGALAIGFIIGSEGKAVIAPFFFDPLQGVLCLFLLDIGVKTGDGLRRDRRVLSPGPLVFGCLMPLIGAALGLGFATLIGLSIGNTVLFMTLAASASYIAVPAAMRIAMPDVQPALYVALPLGVTFPFNLLIGIPLYVMAATYLG